MDARHSSRMSLMSCSDASVVQFLRTWSASGLGTTAASYHSLAARAIAAGSLYSSRLRCLGAVLGPSRLLLPRCAAILWWCAAMLPAARGLPSAREVEVQRGTLCSRCCLFCRRPPRAQCGLQESNKQPTYTHCCC